MAAMSGLPIVWFKIGQKYAVVIEGHVFTQNTEFESFFVYFTSFSIFCVQWDSMRNMDGTTKAVGFPNRGALELIHWYSSIIHITLPAEMFGESACFMK